MKGKIEMKKLISIILCISMVHSSSFLTAYGVEGKRNHTVNNVVINESNEQALQLSVNDLTLKINPTEEEEHKEHKKHRKHKKGITIKIHTFWDFIKSIMKPNVMYMLLGAGIGFCLTKIKDLSDLKKSAKLSFWW